MKKLIDKNDINNALVVVIAIGLVVLSSKNIVDYILSKILN
ncbi:MAG: hypothetical protein U0T69_11340 [Chitinophagales bacterium]